MIPIKTTRCMVFLLLLSCITPGQSASTSRLRIGVSGASVSAGFGTGTTLAHALATAQGRIADDRLDVSTSLLFMSPQEKSTALLPQLTHEKPTVIIALDQLFWFAYGRKELDQRRRDVTIALDLLEKLDLPVYVGDVPRMSNVSRMMLPPERIPSQDHVDNVNKLIHARCRKLPDFHLLPLASWYESMQNGKTVTVNGSSVHFKKPELFNSDGLHVNRRGLALITLLIAESLIENKALKRSAIQMWDVNSLARHLQGCSLKVRVEDVKGNKVESGEVKLDIAALRKQFVSTDFEKHKKLRRLLESRDLSSRNPFFIRGLPGALIGKTLTVQCSNQETHSIPVTLKAGANRAVVTLR